MKDFHKQDFIATIENILSNARKCSVSMSKKDLILNLKILHKMYEIEIMATAMKKNIDYEDTLLAINLILQAEIDIVNGIFEGKTDKELIDEILEKEYFKLKDKPINPILWPKI